MEKGWWVLKNDGVKGTCYTYEVLTQICVSIDRYTDAFGKSHWKYVGGCFKDAAAGKYEEAKPGSTYRFANIPVFIRAANDPYLTVSMGDGSAAAGANHTLKLVGWLLFVVAAGTGIAFRLNLKKLRGSGSGYRQEA